MPLLFAILGVVKGPRPLKFIPALTACTSKRMKTGGFRTLQVLPPGNAVRGKTRKKLEEVNEGHFLESVAFIQFRFRRGCFPAPLR